MDIRDTSAVLVEKLSKQCCDIIGKPGTAAAGFWPTGVREPGGQRTAPFTFLEWVEDWLDKSLNRLL